MPRARPTVLTAVLLLASGLLALPAQASSSAGALAIPVDCASGPVELSTDHLHYRLEGTCGVVRITASDVTVTAPTATRLVVGGRDNTVVTKSVGSLAVRGRHHDVRPVSVRTLRVVSPGSVVAVDGLVETARLGGVRATLRADRVSTLRVPGDHHTVAVARGTTDVRVRGHHNRVRVARRR